jgi:hypothetical protein
MNNTPQFQQPSAFVPDVVRLLGYRRSEDGDGCLADHIDCHVLRR